VRRPRLRLGEYVAILWLVLAGSIFLAAGQWGTRLLKGGAPYFPFVHVLLVSLSVYLVRLILVTIRKIGRLPALAAGARAWEIAEATGYEEEAHLLRAMLSLARDCLPLYCILLVYPTSDLLIDTLQGSRLVDPALIRIDEVVFGGHASVWMQRFVTPAVTDVMSLCYFLHLVIPPLVLVVAALRAPRPLFVEAIEGFVLISLVGVSLYVAFPAIGPLHTLGPLYTRDLSGGLLTEANRAVIDATRVPRDAFPSLHVGISALMLVYAWRTSRAFALAIAPFVVGNWISTMYLRYHYAIDVVAGFALVPLVLFVVRAWTRRFPELSAEPHAPERPGERPAHPSAPDQRGWGERARSAT
jgi:membrane-associated phospholipid phosphatase